MSGNNYSRNRTRIWWAMLTVVVAVSLLLSGCGAEKPKVYRVGILCGLDYFSTTIDGFKAKMTELGYVEGQNIVYDVQKTNVDMAAYKSISQKFVADKVDLIFVFPTEASLEAKAATQGTDIPVLFAQAFLEGNDLVKSVREPGGNITGVRFASVDIARKRFEIFHELVPQAKRMLIPYQRGYPIIPSQLEALRPVAEAAGVTLIELPADNAAEVEAGLQARAKSADMGFDAILCIIEPLTVTPDVLAVLGKFSAEHKVPVGGCAISSDSYGSVFQTAPDNVEVGKLAAPLADKILKGTPAGSLPVVTPENFLGINYKVAQELGLTVPEGLLGQASEIIR
jgi:putative ABC transport system substrate-binding protein